MKYLRTFYKALSVPIILGLVFGSLALLPQTASAACGSGYSFCRTVTVDHTLVYPETLHTTTFSSGSSTGAQTITIPTTTTGSALIIGYAVDDTATQSPTITDSASGSYTFVGDTGKEFNCFTQSQIYYNLNVASGITSVTITPSPAKDFRAVIYEVEGIATSSALDQHGHLDTDTTSPWISSSVTPTQTNEFIASVLSGGPNSPGLSMNNFSSDYQTTMTQCGGSGAIGIFESKFASSTAATNAKFNGNVNNGAEATIATFKQAGDMYLSNFNILASTTLTTLKTTGNGGNIQNTVSFNSQTVPADLVFSSTSDCGTLMSWDVENYVSSTGELEAWVKIPTLSSVTDTVIYMCYGKSSVSTYQGGSVGAAWNSTYALVEHLPNGITLTANDATGNGNNFTNPGSTIVAGTGQIAGVASAFDQTANSYLTKASNTSNNIADNYTISAWVKPSGTGFRGEVLTKYNGTTTYYFYVYPNGANFVLASFDGAEHPEAFATFLPDVWSYVSFTKNGTTGVYQINGSGGVQVTVGTNSTSAAPVDIGAANDAPGANSFKGSLDEVRLANVVRSNNWINTEYNNQVNGSTMVAFGAEQSGSVTAPPVTRGCLIVGKVKITGKVTCE